MINGHTVCFAFVNAVVEQEWFGYGYTSAVNNIYFCYYTPGMWLASVRVI